MRVLLVLTGLAGLATIGVVAGVIGAWYYVEPGLPNAAAIRDIPLQVPLRIYSRDGRLISEVGERRRIPVSYEQVPAHVVNAFVAAEDRRFFEHPGIDYRGVLRAVLRFVRTGNASGGGGSTLTQQLARDYFLTRDQTVARKLREAYLAWKIEQEFDKPQIMALFLNKMFFGQRAYGVAAAGQVFFNKELAELNIAEAATLAGVLPAPSKYNPVSDPEQATVRRGYVLGRMLALDYIDEAAYEEAMAYPMESKSHGAAIELNAPYVAEMVRRDMIERFGRQEMQTQGYQVVTSLDSKLQEAANYAARNGLLAFTRRRGYGGPDDHVDLSAELLATPFADWPDEIVAPLRRYAPGGLSLALVTAVNGDNSAGLVFADGETAVLPWRGIRWAKPRIDRETTGAAPESAAAVLKAGDIIYVMPTAAGGWALAEVPEAQAALVSMDPDDGAITALTGGFDHTITKFNRVTQAYRQPGSSFKPFIYSAALEHGSTVATVVDDSPVVIRSSELEKDWRPINYTGRFYGPTRMREALVRSMNLVSVRLLLRHTYVSNAVRHIANFGFGDAALIPNGSLALGGGNASPLDMVQAYSTIANGGYALRPYVIDSIFGPDGTLLYRARPQVVCEACRRDEDAPEALPLSAAEREARLAEMAEVAETYRQDANDAPELFADVPLAERTVSAQNMFLVQDMMRDVVQRGTGIRAFRELGRRDLSGKTGTSNDRRDAWFGGFNSELVAMVWVGYDDDLPLGPGEEGSRTALPIWIDFMRIALAGQPERQMPMPDGIVSQRIDRTTGCPARAGQFDSIFEYFREGNVPSCDDIRDAPDLFNDAGGIELPGDEDEPAEDDEPLF